MSFESNVKKRATQLIPDYHIENPSDFFDELSGSNKSSSVNLNKFQKGLDDGDLGRRSTQRYSLQMTALIVSQVSTFRTTTVNISTAGVLLAEVVPSHLIGKEFEFLLIDERASGNDKYLRFKASAIGGKFTQRIQFLSSSPETQERLGQLLQDLTALVA